MRLRFTLLGDFPWSFHTLVVSLSTHTDQLFMELVHGQLLQEGLRWKQEGQFNHGIRRETLIVKICF
jgi:hypothetical protein